MANALAAQRSFGSAASSDASTHEGLFGSSRRKLYGMVATWPPPPSEPSEPSTVSEAPPPWLVFGPVNWARMSQSVHKLPEHMFPHRLRTAPGSMNSVSAERSGRLASEPSADGSAGWKFQPGSPPLAGLKERPRPPVPPGGRRLVLPGGTVATDRRNNTSQGSATMEEEVPRGRRIVTRRTRSLSWDFQKEPELKLVGMRASTAEGNQWRPQHSTGRFLSTAGGTRDGNRGPGKAKDLLDLSKKRHLKGTVAGMLSVGGKLALKRKSSSSAPTKLPDHLQENATLVALRDRARELSDRLLEAQEKSSRDRILEQERAKKLLEEKESYENKYKNRVELLAIEREDNSSRDTELAALGEAWVVAKQAVLEKERTSSRAWKLVGDTNGRMQRMQKEYAALHKDLVRISRLRKRAEEDKAQVEAELLPMKGKDLEMKYRVQLRGEWQEAAGDQLAHLEGILANHKTFSLQIGRVIRDANREKNAANASLNTNTQLMVDLESESALMKEDLDSQLEEQSVLQNRLEQLKAMAVEEDLATEELQEEGKEISSLHRRSQRILEIKQEETQKLVTQLKEIQRKIAREVNEARRTQMEIEITKDLKRHSVVGNTFPIEALSQDAVLENLSLSTRLPRESTPGHTMSGSNIA